VALRHRPQLDLATLAARAPKPVQARRTDNR